MKVCVVGLGEVGKPTAQYIMRFHEFYGYDTKQGVPWENVPICDKIPICDIYVICVPTDAVESACMSIPHGAKLAAVESTVDVGTCKRIYEAVGVPVVHCPHRWWGVDPINHGVRQPRVLGGVTEEALQFGIKFYQSIEVPLHVVRPVEVAEFSKIVENAHEYLKIAFAEEIMMICNSEFKIPFDQVRQACNTNITQDINLMEAREGIGGKCLPWAAESLKPYSFIMREAIRANQEYEKLFLGKEAKRSEA